MTFDKAQANLIQGNRDYRQYDHVRKSIFGGVAVCGLCGYSLCSSGTVYKGEREKYWFLSCNHKSKRYANPCQGVDIKYSDFLELVRQDLNSLISLTDEEIDSLVNSVLAEMNASNSEKVRESKIEKARMRLKIIDRTIEKLYIDNAEGKLSDSRLESMVTSLEKEASGLESDLELLNAPSPYSEVRSNYDRFFALAKQFSRIEVLDRDTLITFIDKIVVGPKMARSPTETLSKSSPFNLIVPRKQSKYKSSLCNRYTKGGWREPDQRLQRSPDLPRSRLRRRPDGQEDEYHTKREI